MKKNVTIIYLLSMALVTNAQFAPQQVLSDGANNTKLVHAADLDGDGDMDVLATSSVSGEYVFWIENLGGGVFGGQQNIDCSSNPDKISAKDMDGDGDLDLLIFYSNGVRIYENLGMGVFNTTYINLVAGPDFFAYYAIVDLDGDSDLDLVCSTSNSLIWYENQDSLNFTFQTISTTLLFKTTIIMGDVDGDMDVDIISYKYDTLLWFPNNGLGGFGPHQVIRTGVGNPRILEPADMDGDGDLDVLTYGGPAPFEQYRARWYENLGGGSFAPGGKGIASLLEGVSGMMAADVDNDGDIDFITGRETYSSGFYYNKILWYDNPGDGLFIGSSVIAVLGDSSTIVNLDEAFAADLDNDGDLDVLSATADDNTVAWYENNVVACDVTASFTYTDNGSGNYSFSNNSTGNFNKSRWSFGDGSISTASSLNHTFSANGTFMVVLAVKDSTIGGACTRYSIDTVHVTGVVNPLQCVAGYSLYRSSSIPNSFTLVNSSVGSNLSYLWDFGDGGTSAQQYPSHSYYTAGPFNLCLTVDDSAGCIDTYCDSLGIDGVVFKQAGFTINGIAPPIADPDTTGGPDTTIASIDHDWELISEVELYPNPLSDQLTIAGNQLTINQIKIIDVTGKMIITINQHTRVVNVADLSSGIYFIRVITDERIVTKKFVKL